MKLRKIVFCLLANINFSFVAKLILFVKKGIIKKDTHQECPSILYLTVGITLP